MKKFKPILVILFIVALFVTIYFLFFNKEKTDATEIIKAEKKETGQNKPVKTSSIPVKVVEITHGDLPLRLKISGTAKTREKTSIKAEVSGKVENVLVRDGQWVKRGQLLVRIEDIDKKLEVEKASATKLKSLAQYLIDSEFDDILKSEKSDPDDQKKFLKIKSEYLKAISDFNSGKLSQKQFDRIAEKYENQMVSSGSLRQEIKKANDGLANAIISLKQARLNLKRTYIRSPFEGIISGLTVSRGENINTGQALMNVVNLKTVYMEGYALESEIKYLKKKTRVRIKFDSFTDTYFYGNIESISPEVNTTNKTISIFVEVDNREYKILPGMHAEMDVEYKIVKNIFKVPLKAIIVRQDRPLIFVVAGKIVNWVYVDLGPKNDEEQGILKFYSDVKEGDRVVIEGHSTLAHQSRIRILK